MAEFIKQFGVLADRALTEPVTITKNGRDRLVVLSIEEYARLKRRDRRAFNIDELTDAQIAALASAEVSQEHAHLEDELTDDTP